MRIIVHTIDGQTVVGQEGASPSPISDVIAILDMMLAHGPIAVYPEGEPTTIVTIPSSNVSRVTFVMSEEEATLYREQRAGRESKTPVRSDVLECGSQGTVGTDERDGSADA